MILGQLNRKQTLDIAMVVGKVLLMSGAETSRVGQQGHPGTGP